MSNPTTKLDAKIAFLRACAAVAKNPQDALFLLNDADAYARLVDRDPIAVVARLWFDGTNTYHSIRVIWNIDGKLNDFIVPFEYGYGDTWQSTFEAVIGVPFHTYRAGVRLVVADVCNVSRRRDLHLGGKGKEG